MKKEKIKFIRVSLIICTIIIIAILITILFLPNYKELKMINYINSNKKIENQYRTIENEYVAFYNYRGNVDSSILEKSIWYFTENLIEEYYNIDSIEEYYNSKSDIIKNMIGIEDYETFYNFVTYIKTLNGSELKLERVGIYPDTEYIKNNSIKFDIFVQFSGNDRLVFCVNMTNKYDSNKCNISYSLEEVNKIEKLNTKNEQKSETKETNTQIEMTGRAIN